MADIIRLLPDSVANQIAAGEVIQRPASVVKELVENAVDAGSSEISVIIKDAGKTLIQVIDNGCGMSETDARMSFERHATSKISNAEQLFALQTKGFRGEALASIAAIAHVELRTRRHDEEIGVKIQINGSELVNQEPIQTPAGTQFLVKNLFYNVPARRNFLKSDPVELKHIIDEFQRVALAHPSIQFKLTHNESEIFNLANGGYKQRIVSVFGNRFNDRLVPLDEETSLVKVSGFIGKPEYAKRSRGEQYFFVNDRFIKSHYLNHAVVNAFEGLLSKDQFPSYWIYLTVDPSRIDINIHPTKTEVKFDDERSIYAILRSAAKRGIGKYSVSPSLDFDQEMSVNIPAPSSSQPVVQPMVQVDESYNPFHTTAKTSAPAPKTSRSSKSDWESLYQISQQIHNQEVSIEPQADQTLLDLPQEVDADKKPVFQLFGKYLVSTVKSGLIVVDQKRAHERVLFESYLKSLEESQSHIQPSLFPEDIQLSSSDAALLKSMLTELKSIGFDIETKSADVFVINGVPAELAELDGVKTVELFLEQFKHSQNEKDLSQHERIALSLARSNGIKYGRNLERQEMEELIGKLFACELPYYTASGKPTLFNFTREDLEQKFNF